MPIAALNLVYSTTTMNRWLDAGFTDLGPMLTTLSAHTALLYVIPIMVGVAMLGHLFRVLFGRGGIEAGASALSDRFSDNSGEWNKLENRAREVNGWKGD